jgi:uncharacterized membrane protein YbhN (UPF0104 family)
VLAALVLVAGSRYAARFPWGETWRILASAEWGPLAAAAGVNLLSLACKGGGWYLLLRPLARARLRTAQAATFVGAAVGSIGISVSGEAARAHMLTQQDGLEVATVARTIASSRLVEAAALGVFLAALALGAGGTLEWRMLAGAVTVGAAALAVLRWLPWLRPFREDGRLAPHYSVGQLLAPLALALAAWALQWTTYHFSILAVHANVPPYRSAVALLVANLGGILRLTPANAGIVQGALVVGLAPAGVPATQAVAAGLALQAVQVLPVLLIGIILLGRHGIRATWIASRSRLALRESINEPIADMYE